MEPIDNTSFPPPGWVTNHEAARMLGVSVATLTCVAWRWRLRCGKCVRRPEGGRCNIYPVAEIERTRQARAAAEALIPEGFVDRDGACRMFDVTRCVWKQWIRQGKVRFGQIVSSPRGGKKRLYAIEDLERLRDELFGEDKLFKGSDGIYHVPAEFIRREEAWERFGVSKPVWERWEREGRITCGQRVPGGPKLYRVENIQRMLDEYGRWTPPYPDPARPGCVRVPMSGRDIRRREVLIDADAMPLIEGGSCSWSATDIWGFVAFSRGGMQSTPLRRIITGVAESGSNVRHLNGDPLDCRRENLVVRTVQQRLRNARKIRSIKGRPPTSRFKGVFWETQTKKWRARIRMEGKGRSLGRFRDEMAAAVAYDEAARIYFGEHARLNFPDGIDAWLDTRSVTRAA
jgi:hypothetical protein